MHNLQLEGHEEGKPNFVVDKP